MNNLAATKYSDIRQITNKVSKQVNELDEKCKRLSFSFLPFLVTKYCNWCLYFEDKKLLPVLEVITQLQNNITKLEEAAYKLDGYARKLEERYKVLEKRYNATTS